MAFTPSQASGDILVDEPTLALIEGGSGEYRVLSVLLNQDNELDGVLGDVIQTTWQPVGRAGTFVTIVRWSREWDVETAATVAYEWGQVKAIYAL